MTADLTREERATLETIEATDELPEAEYRIERGPLSGHALAENGFSMVADLTTGANVDADSIEEADEMIASAAR